MNLDFMGDVGVGFLLLGTALMYICTKFGHSDFFGGWPFSGKDHD